MPGGSLVESIDRCPDGPGHDLQTEMSMSEHNSPTLYFLAKLCTHVDSPFLGAIPTHSSEFLCGNGSLPGRCRATSANMAALLDADHVPSRPMLKDSTP